MNLFEINSDMLMSSLSGLLPFASYFFVGIVLTGLFVLAYTIATPYSDSKLIKENNIASAISFFGALIGFTLALVSVMNGSANIIDMVMWGVIAIVIQVATFKLVQLPFPKTVERIENGEVAMGITLASLSIAIGMLNAAALTY